MEQKSNKKAQLTIFVIIGIILVASIIVIFAISPDLNLPLQQRQNPQFFIEDCVKSFLDTTGKEIIDKSGYINIPEPNMEWTKGNIAYFCYAEGLNEKCLNLQPMLINKMESEIYNEIDSEVEECFESLKEQYAGWEYEEKTTNFEIEIKDGLLIANIEKEIKIRKNEEAITLELFRIGVDSPLYDFGVISNEIINQEASCDCSQTCNADVVSISLDQRGEYEVERFITSDGEKVYTIVHPLTGSKFNFAVRNCVLG